MLTADSNIEPVARAVCERDVRSWPSVAEAEIPGLVDRFWPVVASKIVAGLITDDGRFMPHPVEAGILAWERWLDDRR